MHFQYSDTNKLNGILHYLYTKYPKSEYYKIVTADASSYQIGGSPQCAIDFDDNYYWYAEREAEGEYITIHFPYHIIDIEGYEIKTSNHQDGCHPKKWSFSASTNIYDFTNTEMIEDTNGEMHHSFASKYFPYKKGKYDYFRLTIYNSYWDTPKTDINQIELYGTLHSRIIQSCKQKREVILCNFLYILCFQK